MFHIKEAPLERNTNADKFAVNVTLIAFVPVCLRILCKPFIRVLLLSVRLVLVDITV